MYQPPVDDAADALPDSPSVRDEDGHINFCDNGARQTQQKAEERANCPTRPAGNLHAANDQADPEAIKERAKERGLFVGERHRHHHANRNGSENNR